MFHDVIGEPKGAHSVDCVWKNSYKCYNGGKNCCYIVLTYICAIPAVFCWGCEFACITFYQIWCVTPFVRCFNMIFVFIARMWHTCAHCLYDPIFESASLLCTQIFVHHINDGKSYKSRRVEDINMMVGGAAITVEQK